MDSLDDPEMGRVTVRVPEPLRDDVDRVSNDQGRTRSAVVRDALRRYVEVHDGRMPETGPQKDLHAVTDRLAHHVRHLSKRVDELD